MIHDRWVNLGWLALRRLEPYDAKVSSTVLKGRGCGNTALLPDNTLIDDKSQAITIIDLGEIAISHPFFSLLNCLHVIKKHYALTNADDTYLKIKDACLKNYMRFESEKNVLNAFEIAYVLWFAYGLLAHDRLMQACGKEKLMSFQHGKLSEMLKEFIAVCAGADRNVQFT
jgi:hypothetical protein